MKIQTLRTITNHPLTKKNKAGAVFRLIKRGAVIRLNKNPIVYPFIENTQLLVIKGMTSAELQIYTGLYEFNEMSFLLHFLESKDLFVDIGANIGVYSVLASGVRKASTIAIEPIPTTYNHLINNLKLNNIQGSVTALNIGVSKTKGTLAFTQNLDAINHVIRDTDSTGDSAKIPVDKLDHILKNKSPALIKIDVEGFETNVIKGGLNVLSNPSLKAIIIETNGLAGSYHFDDKWIHSTLLKNGFTPFVYNPFERELKLLESPAIGNTIYLRDLELVVKRIESNPTFKVLNIDI